MFFLVAYCLLDLMVASHSSELIDAYTQAAYQQNMAKYCSKIGKCQPGTHVACMYYAGPYSVMGPKCDTKAKPVQLTKVIQDKILSSVNRLRMRVSRGLETGTGGKTLPKAYAMNQVEWDQELADLAQLWANQCDKGHDKCRSTVKFPNVVQNDYTIKHPKWRNDDVDHSRAYDLTSERVEEIIDAIFKTWDGQRRTVTRKIILTPKKINAWMHLLNGRMTHMGCGMVAYSSICDKKFTQNPCDNIAKLVCNWSEDLAGNKKVYEVDLSRGERSEKCGCYPGQTEGQGCLCVGERARTKRSLSSPLRSDMESNTTGSGTGMSEANCKSHRPPTVVLLPIFTIENAGGLTLSKLENATHSFFNSLPVQQAITRLSKTKRTERPFLRSKTLPITQRHRLFGRMHHQEMNRKSNIRNIKSIRDLSHLKENLLEYLLYNSEHPIKTRVAPVDSTNAIKRSSVAKISHITPVKIEPVNFDYTGFFENSAGPRTRRVRFGPKEINYYNTPEKNVDDSDYNQLLNALLEELLHQDNLKDMEANIRNHEAGILDYQALARVSKPVARGNLIDNLERYEDEATSDGIYSNVDYGQPIREAINEAVWPAVRKQSPLIHTALDANNFDYYINDNDYENEKVIREIERDILLSNLAKDGIKIEKAGTDDFYRDKHNYRYRNKRDLVFRYKLIEPYI